MTPALGLILAGGRARRMGGADKALLALGGRPMLAHVIERLRPQCFALALSANGDPRRFAAFGLPVAPDERPDFSGPLAGLLAGLEFSAKHFPGLEDVVTLPADTPFLPLDLVARLFEARRQAGAEIALARSGGRDHLAALWPVSLAAALRRALFDEGLRKVGAFAARYALAHADWAVEPFDPFFNVNTPEDIGEAEGLLTRA